ncbi:hypothetical protein [Variovorax sp. J22R115]|uniref:hypothetical protein n=1 Tax=Variovorax sp. J22R115 TaxID=3053509 RepID=UPI002578F501|nr:hypothetical protein [Variovorax sp. J22R115]MDM0048853.1 hypothetical protein [Variovorax sp. J22R115]
MTTTQTKALFYCGALFNWGGVLILSLLAGPLGLQPPHLNLFGQIALLAIFAFGCGYWMVGSNPRANRGIVVLGIFSKLGVVAIVWAHWLAGNATTQMAALVMGDVLFALLFAMYLKRSAA